MDNRQVIVGSNCFPASEYTSMKRYSKKVKSKVFISFTKLLNSYNKSMERTDKMDWQQSRLRRNWRRKKYYFHIFNWIIGAALINSWLFISESIQKLL